MTPQPPTPQPAPPCAAEFDQARSLAEVGFVYLGAHSCSLERGHRGLHQCGMTSWNDEWTRRSSGASLADEAEEKGPSI